MNKKNNIEHNSNPLWLKDDIQFARMLSEIYAVGISEDCYADISERTGLSKQKIVEIFQRAKSSWDGQKLLNLIG